MADVSLRASDLWLSYAGPDVVRGVTLTLTAGAPPVGIIGPSGAGKSAVVAALLGQLRPTRGTVTFEGRTVSKLSRGDKKAFRTRVRAITQDGVGPDPGKSVVQVMSDAATKARRAGRTNPVPIATQLEDVELGGPFAHRIVGSLSGGERQRLALALVLATRPEVLILDEPLAAVDPAMRGRMVRTIAASARRSHAALLVVSHDLELVERLCPSVYFMADGVFVASGSMREVLTTDHPVIRGLALAAPLAVQRFH